MVKKKKWEPLQLTKFLIAKSKEKNRRVYNK